MFLVHLSLIVLLLCEMLVGSELILRLQYLSEIRFLILKVKYYLFVLTYVCIVDKTNYKELLHLQFLGFHMYGFQILYYLCHC